MKFNIKKFVKVSAVALVMISAGGIASTVNANTNVHADSIDYTALFNEADKMDAPMDKRVKSWQANQEKVNASANDKAALTDLQVNKQLDPEDIQDPYTVSYLHSKGYTDQQLRDAVKSTEKAMESNDSSSKDNYGSDRIIKHDNAIVNKAKKLHIDPNEALLNPSIINKVSNETKAYHIKNRIYEEKKQLSTRRARKAMNNYKRNHKSNRYVKHLMQTNKDLSKREKDLARITKSTRKTRSTKHNSHRSLKRVRKNKNTKRNRRNKRNHKKINKHTHKHMKHNNHKNHRNRK